MTLSDKKEFIRAIWLHHIFFSVHAELEQLRKGLRNTLQVELLACIHGEHLHSLLTSTRAFDLTSENLVDELVIIKQEDTRRGDQTTVNVVIKVWTYKKLHVGRTHLCGDVAKSVYM